MTEHYHLYYHHHHRGPQYIRFTPLVIPLTPSHYWRYTMKFCTHCGEPQDEDVRHELPIEPYWTLMEVSALLLSNPDTIRCALKTHAHRFNRPTYRRRHLKPKLR